MRRAPRPSIKTLFSQDDEEEYGEEFSSIHIEPTPLTSDVTSHVHSIRKIRKTNSLRQKAQWSSAKSLGGRDKWAIAVQVIDEINDRKDADTHARNDTAKTLGTVDRVC